MKMENLQLELFKEEFQLQNQELLNDLFDEILDLAIILDDKEEFLNILLRKQDNFDESEYVDFDSIYHTQYKGLYYKYNEYENMWSISVDSLGESDVLKFNADIYRIDQCLKIANEKIKKCTI